MLHFLAFYYYIWCKVQSLRNFLRGLRGERPTYMFVSFFQWSFMNVDMNLQGRHTIFFAFISVIYKVPIELRYPLVSNVTAKHIQYRNLALARCSPSIFSLFFPILQIAHILKFRALLPRRNSLQHGYL